MAKLEELTPDEAKRAEGAFSAQPDSPVVRELAQGPLNPQGVPQGGGVSQGNILQRGYRALGDVGAAVAGKGHDIVAPVRRATDAASNVLPSWLTRFKDPTPTRQEAEAGGRFLAQEGATTAAGLALTGGLGLAGQAGARAMQMGPLGRVLLPKAGQFLGNTLGGAGTASAQGGDPTTGALIGAGVHMAAEGLASIGAVTAKLAAGRQALQGYRAKRAYDKAFHEAVDALEQQGHQKQVVELRSQYAEEVRKIRTGNQQASAEHANEVQRIRNADAARIRQEKADYRSANKAAEAEHATATAAHAEQAATKLADEFKSRVPALKDFSSDSQGLTDMVVGRGQQAVSTAFDQSLKDVITKGSGTRIALSAEDAKSLGIKNMVTPPKPVAPSGRGFEPPVQVEVDAGEVAQHLTGFWKKDPGVYRRAAEALDRADLGDPAARNAYRSFQGLVQYIDKTKALKSGVLDPEKLVGGLYDVGKVNILRKRGLGNVFEGPMQAARGGPLAPRNPEPFVPSPLTPLPMKPMPRALPPRPQSPLAPNRMAPPDPEKNFTQSALTAPGIGGVLGHVGGAVAGAPLGHPFLGSMLGGPVGAGMGRAIGGSEGIAMGKLSPDLIQLLTMYPGLLSVLARQPIASQSQP